MALAAPPPLEPDPASTGEGTDMTISIFDTVDALPPMGAVSWQLTRALVVDTDSASITALRGQMTLQHSTDIDVVATADEALDMIGYVSQPFDAILIGAGRKREAGLHVLSVLRRQRAPFVVVGHSFGAPPPTHVWSDYAGVATWLNLEDGERWPRRLARVVEINLTVEHIMKTARVPWHLEEDLASAIYQAVPGERFQLPPTS
jgi:hypothetical protein